MCRVWKKKFLKKSKPAYCYRHYSGVLHVGVLIVSRSLSYRITSFGLRKVLNVFFFLKRNLLILVFRSSSLKGTRVLVRVTRPRKAGTGPFPRPIKGTFFFFLFSNYLFFFFFNRIIVPFPKLIISGLRTRIIYSGFGVEMSKDLLPYRWYIYRTTRWK